MYLTYCAYLAAGICLIGIAWRICRWFTASIGPEAMGTDPVQRIAAVVRATTAAWFSPALFRIIGRWSADVILQRRIASQSKIRWAMHMGLFYGVLLLVVVHALDNLVLAPIVDDYASTLNPYRPARNLLGLFVLVGVGIAIIRRTMVPVLKRFNTRADRFTLVLLVLIPVSGVALEAVQLISAPIFEEMVVDYMGDDAPEETTALRTYWAVEYGIVFETPPARDEAALDRGRELHEAFCAECHSRPGSAFMAYPVARLIKPLSGVLERLRIDLWLWQIHYLLSCLALAWLPFGKLFHLVSVPFSLAVRCMGETRDSAPDIRPVRRALGLDACTHCGVCSDHCSVAPIMTVIDNPTILPSEKTGAVGRMVRRRLTPQQQWGLAQGSDICTECGRCTDVCPSGIDLQDLWQAGQHDLTRYGCAPPHAWIRRRTMVEWAESTKTSNNGDRDFLTDVSLGLADNPDTFWACVQCTTCTSVCPVVAASNNPRDDLDLTPQQVMNLMRLELKEMALGCRMVWDCVTCYKCQEHCPQGVPVADVLYELRNEACRRLVPDSGPADPRVGPDAARTI